MEGGRPHSYCTSMVDILNNLEATNGFGSGRRVRRGAWGMAPDLDRFPLPVSFFAFFFCTELGKRGQCVLVYLVNCRSSSDCDQNIAQQIMNSIDIDSGHD